MPPLGTQAQYNQLRGLEEGFINNINRAVSASVQMNFTFAAAMQMSAALGVSVAKLMNANGQIMAGISDDTFRRANYIIGLRAQQSTAAAYSQRRPRRRLPSYRVGPLQGRYAGGALLRAIKAPDFFRATATGLQFINTSRLDREAKQWKRLNFGAGAGAIRPPGRYEVSFNGLLVATLGLTPDPRPGFKMPPGFFLGPNGRVQRGGEPGTGMFYPTGRPLMSPTYGIVGTNFLDAGVRRIARELGPVYFGLMQGHLDQALTKAFGDRAPSVDFKVPRFRVAGASRAAAPRIAMPDLDPTMRKLYETNLRIYRGSARPERSNPRIRPGGGVFS